MRTVDAAAAFMAGISVSAAVNIITGSASLSALASGRGVAAGLFLSSAIALFLLSLAASDAERSAQLQGHGPGDLRYVAPGLYLLIGIGAMISAILFLMADLAGRG